MSAHDLSVSDIQLLFEAAPALFLVVKTDDPVFTIVSASDEYLRATRMSRQDLLGRSLFEVFEGPDPTHHTTLDNLRASFQRVLATRQPDSMPVQHYNLPKPDSLGGGFEDHYWSPVNSPVTASGNEVRFIIHRVEDVTSFVEVKRLEAEQGRLAEAERLRAEKIEAELFLRSRELTHVKELTQQRHLLTLLAEQSQEYIGVSDLSGLPVYANHTAMALLGARDFEELRHLPLEACFVPEERSFVQEVVLPAVRDQGRWEGELHLQQLHTQEIIPVLYIVFRVDEPTTRQPTHLATIAHDLRERKRAEQELQESEALFTRAFAEAPIGMVLTTPYGEILEPNHAFLQMIGYTREELTSQDSKGFTHPDDVGPTRAFYASLREGSLTTAVLEKRYIRKDGQIVWARASGTMRRDRRGRAAQLIAIVEDITERKRLEQALLDSQKRLQQVFAQAPVGVCVLRGPELIFELANPSYEEFLPGRAILGQPILKAVPDLDPKIAGFLQHVLKTGEPFTANELLIPVDRNGDGIVEETWFNLLYHPLREPDGAVSGIVAVVIDVTAQVLARQELERLNRELEEFAYVASHDLQEPLRMVNIYTQMILKRLGGESEKLSEYGHFVEEGVARMETLIRDLLTFSRTVQRQELPVGAANLSASLAEALGVLKSRLEETGARVTANGLPVVRGDSDQLAHVFQNLLSNALKYRRKEVTPEISITASPHDDTWIISVCDNGIGFDPQYADRIFGLFKRLHKDAYPGTGLGLAICQRIVERYGGRIWAEGRPGEGATFYFKLPGAEL